MKHSPEQIKEAMLYYKETLDRKATMEKYDLSSYKFRSLKETWYQENNIPKPVRFEDMLFELSYQMATTIDTLKKEELKRIRKILLNELAFKKFKEIEERKRNDEKYKKR